MAIRNYDMHEYVYEGPVVEYDRVVAHRWMGKTMAPSEAKARSNLAFQFKKQNGRAMTNKITLPGKVIRHEARRTTS